MKEYIECALRGQIKKEDVDKINKGIKINNIIYERIKIKIDKSK